MWLIEWFHSRASLQAEVYRLRMRLLREKDAREILERERCTLLDTLDRLSWDSRYHAARYKSAVEGMGTPQ